MEYVETLAETHEREFLRYRKITAAARELPGDWRSRGGCHMGHYLIVTWDGAGNLVPTLGITRALVERGHDVRLIGHESIAQRCGDGGARFVPWSQGEGRDAMDHPDDVEVEVRRLIEDLFFSSTIAGDLARELDREPADAVLVDCTLFTAIDVVLASGTPTATLFHTPYTIFRAGPLVEMFAPGIPIANAHRTQLGLPPVEKLGDIHDACARAIVAVPKEFVLRLTSR